MAHDGVLDFGWLAGYHIISGRFTKLQLSYGCVYAYNARG